MSDHSGIYQTGRIHTRVHTFLVAELKAAGFPDIVPSQGSILATLYRKNPQTMQEIARGIHRDKSTVTYLVQGLLVKGYVTKAKSMTDGRSTQICLTAKANTFHDVFVRISRDINNNFYRHLSEEEASELERLLAKVVEGWGVDESDSKGQQK